MRFVKFSLAVICAVLALSASAAPPEIPVALKSGESTEVMDLYWVINCRSLLTAPTEVTILDGPQGVTASAPEAMVVPRAQQCANPVKGAKLVLTAGQIEDASSTIMTVRIRYHTKDGVREMSPKFSIQLFP